MAVQLHQLIGSEDLLARSADEGGRYEIIEGELRELAPTGGEHGGVEVEVAFLIRRYLTDHPIGRVFGGEVLCRLRREPETARAADVGFIRAEQLPDGRLPVGPTEGAPDLAVEVISPGDRAGEVQEKIAQWLAGGASVVWAVYPASRGVVVWRGTGATPLLRGEAEVDAEPVLPGFRCRAQDCFGPQ
jgi:Uma2 family endonuclease